MKRSSYVLDDDPHIAGMVSRMLVPVSSALT
jgi:hypothetical protein